MTSSISEEIISTALPDFDQLIYQCVNFRFRTHIDPPGRFIENDQDWFGRQPSGYNYFLLVAAAQIFDLLLDTRGFDPHGIFIVISDALLFSLIDREEFGYPLNNSHANIAPDVYIKQCALLFSVFRHERNPLVNCFSRRFRVALLAIQDYASAGFPLTPKSNSANSVRPAPISPANPNTSPFLI